MTASPPGRAGNSTLGVVILGAGASSRMGRPKLLLPWGRTSVIGHLLRRWRALGAGQIAVVCRPADTALGKELSRRRLPARHRIENPRPERGMFSSIVCAANWDGWEQALRSWVIVLGDQPHLSLGTLRALLEFHRRRPGAICQPAYRGKRGHPVILPRKAFRQLRLSTAGSLKGFLRETTVPIIECSIDDRSLSLDLDRPQDYILLSPQIKRARHEEVKPR